MATRKTGTALAVRQKQELIDWEKELAKDADAAAEAEKSFGVSNFISTKGGDFTYRGEVVPAPLQVIVLDAVPENRYYTGKFDPNNPASPVCYAIGRDPETLAPPADAPQRQAETCAVCPMNEFGSGDTGRGKGCKNMRRLAVVAADKPDDITADTEIAMLLLPPTSLKHWAGYVKKCRNALNRPPYGVVTAFDFVPSGGGSNVPAPKFVDKLDDPAVLTVVKGLRAAAQDDLLRQTFIVADETTTAPAGGKRRAPVAQAARRQPAAVPGQRRAKF